VRPSYEIMGGNTGDFTMKNADLATLKLGCLASNMEISKIKDSEFTSQKRVYNQHKGDL
jgi:hypothetical protein